MAEQVPAVGNVLTEIERRDWGRVERLLSPSVHWTTAIEEHLHGPAAVLAMLQRDARTLEAPVSWQCGHQMAGRILNRIAERAKRVGHLPWALRAAELQLALPFDAATRERLQADLRRVRARLN